MNSRTQEILNRIELIARRLEMSVEDAVAILEGKHPTHVVVQKYKELTPPNPISAPTATVGSQVSATPQAPSSGPAADAGTASAQNPTTSGPADASAGMGGQSDAAFTDVNSGSNLEVQD